MEGPQIKVDVRHLKWSDFEGIQPRRTGLTRGDATPSRWIDRIGNMPDYLIDFYQLYGTKVQEVMDGQENWLSNPEKAEFNSGAYHVTVNTINGSTDFTFPAGSSNDVIQEAAGKAVQEIVENTVSEYTCFMNYLTLCMNYDYPEAFWTGNAATWGNTYGYSSTYYSSAGTGTVEYNIDLTFILKRDAFDYRIPEFRDPTTLSSAVTEFKTKVNSITESYKSKTRYEQVSGLNDWLTKHNSYNSDLLQTEDAADIAWSSMSALRESTGALGPVCEGYARAFKCLCDKLSIPCILANGNAKSSKSGTGEAHMWNEVQMENSNWYAVDVTWNDPIMAGADNNQKESGGESDFWLLLGQNDEVAPGFTFAESHPNTPAGDNPYQSRWDLLFASLITDTRYEPGGSGSPAEVMNDGDWFMGKSAEGLDMNFQVISAKDKTCKVAAKKFDRIFHAIDVNTEGTVTIPAEVNGFKVVAIDDMAFYFCGGVTSFVLPEGLISIGAEAFEKCWAVKSFNIPSTVTTIKGGAFYNCLFERITIPKSVTSIGEEIFFWCFNLKSVEVEAGNPVYDSRDNCNAIIETATNKLVATCQTSTIPEDVKIIGPYACGGNDSFSASLSEGIEVIEDRAFHRCSLGSIILPSTVKSMGEELFVDEHRTCESLISVTVQSAEPCKISDKTFAGCPNLTTLNVPAGSKAAYAAAEGWKNFKEIVEAVVDVEVVYAPNEEEKTVSVQASDESKQEVEIQPSVTIEGEKYEVTAIAESAFENNTTILKVTIPETISEIGENAFAGCRNLKEIRVFAEEPIKLGSSTASGTRGSGASSVFAKVDMETCVLYVPAGPKEKYEQAEGWKEFKNIVEMGETAAITIGKSGKASYCGDKSLDFGYSDKVKAYIATGFDKDEGTIWLTRVKDVPAGVPVLIKGDANKTYDVPVTDSQNSYYTNMFVGNTSGEKMVIQETDGDMMNYYLSGDGTFKSVNKTANIGTNKCYLQLPGTFEAAATGETQTVKVGSIGKASFAAPVDLDFTNVDGLKAFTATGYDKSTKTIWLTRVMKVQKGEGVLLKGDPNSYEIPSVAVQSSYENMFVGNTSGNEIQVLETSEDGSQTNYYLKGDGSFVSVNGYVNIKNNKCYLALPTSMVAVSSTRSAEDDYKFEEPEVIKLPIEFKSIGSEGDGTTSIKNLTPALSEGEGEWFTLQGQRVAKPGKGLYIRNGKKVVIK